MSKNTLTDEQEEIILKKIEELRELNGRIALRKNDGIFKLLVTLNANGFIDGDTFRRLDCYRFEAFQKTRRFSQ